MFDLFGKVPIKNPNKSCLFVQAAAVARALCQVSSQDEKDARGPDCGSRRSGMPGRHVLGCRRRRSHRHRRPRRGRHQQPQPAGPPLRRQCGSHAQGGLRQKLLGQLEFGDRVRGQALFLCNICVVFRQILPLGKLLFVHASTNATDDHKYSLLPSADFDIAKVLVSFLELLFLVKLSLFDFARAF